MPRRAVWLRPQAAATTAQSDGDRPSVVPVMTGARAQVANMAGAARRPAFVARRSRYHEVSSFLILLNLGETTKPCQLLEVAAENPRSTVPEPMLPAVGRA